eukprot:Nitzschia sp. Nitz4//scaffold13_size275219//52123//53444//NITZ4_000848-RA/size275219-augustus-gene-0.252-mRNA-1//-1//CDS//3329535936//3205//frame0
MPLQASSALVNVADDAELRLVRLLTETAESTSPSFVQDCEACISSGDASRLLKTIMGERGALAALYALQEEAVSAVFLLAALLDRTKPADASKLVEQLADSLVQAAPESVPPSAVVSLLATLYNMRAEPLEKVSLIIKMIQFAVSRQPSLLEPNTSVLGKWLEVSFLCAMLDDWKIQPALRRPLYLAAAQGVPSKAAKQQFTVLAVETYTSSDVDAEGLKAAEAAAVGAIRDPVSLFTQQRSILSLPAIQALSAKSSTLLKLLEVFQEGKLEDYQSFIQANGGDDVLKQWDLTAEECVRYMRILSLCSLASEHEEIPYQVVADTLQTPVQDVEKWVIAAVSSGLLSAKMDQLQDKVIVERSVVRKFDMAQWKAVQSRLHLWKKNVGSILAAYKESLGEPQQ